MKVLKIIGGVVVGVAAVAAAPFTGGGSILAGAAALGLGTTAAIAGAVAAGTFGGGLVSYLTRDQEKVKIGLIGMASSGKTTFLNKLRNFKGQYHPTSTDKYESFNFKLSTGKTIVIEKGKDIGGAKNYITFYRDIIKNNDIILYFFNIHEYLKDNDYRRECNSRLAHINETDLSNYGILDGFNKQINDKIIIVASHSDKSSNSSEMLMNEMLKQVNDKNYSDLFNNVFLVLNLTNSNQVENLINKIFGE
jgi:GTPase SAR1 family protein